MPLRIGIVGAGFGSRCHIPAFRSDDRVSVRAIAASRLSRASVIGSQYDLPDRFDSWQELVASPNVDVVSVAVPPAIQPRIVLEALRREKPVFVEKPMAATLWDAVSMTELAKSSGVPAVVNFGFPELPAFRVARAALATLVPLRSVAVQWNIESRINATRLDHWKASAALGGGTLANFVAHSLHYLEWFLGPLESLQAELATAPGDPRTGDTFAALVFRFASGVAGSLSVSAAACGGSGHAIEFSGEGGTVLLRNPTHDPMRGFVVTRTSRDGHCETLDAPSPDTDPGEDSRLEPTRRIAKRLIDWVLAGTPATPNFAAGLRVQALLSAAREGAHDGRRIDLRELALT